MLTVYDLLKGEGLRSIGRSNEIVEPVAATLAIKARGRHLLSAFYKKSL